jgi:rare lipoprotein A
LPHPFAKLGALAGALALLLPAAAVADGAPSGGMLYDDASAPTVTADGSRLSAPLGGLLGGTLRFDGRLTSSRPGDTVVVQRLDARAGWVTAATTTVGADGGFTVAWVADHAGRTTVRVLHDAESDSAQAAAAFPTRDVTVYRPAVATWYGPGFYGHTTACGLELTPELVGVAHRSLPCGTNVAVRYGSRTLVLPVVDRGPFGSEARWDLTEAAAQQLGVTHTDRIGAVPVP